MFDEETVRRRFPEIDPELYPHLDQMGFPSRTDREKAFEEGLEVVLEGIARRYARR